MRSSSLIEASWAGRRNSEPLRYRRSLKMPDAARIDSCHSLLAPTNTIYLNISVELCMVLGPESSLASVAGARNQRTVGTHRVGRSSMDGYR